MDKEAEVSIFCEVTRCYWLIGSRRFETACWSHIQFVIGILDP
jgi:hypothetical protein